MLRRMKFVLFALCLSVLGCAEKKAETQTPVERGKYLVTVTGCHDCHTPSLSNMESAGYATAQRPGIDQY